MGRYYYLAEHREEFGPMPASAGTHKDRLVGIGWHIVHLNDDGVSLVKTRITAITALRGRKHTTKELSSESVYQHSFVEEKGASWNSGRKIETKCLMASTAGAGTVDDSFGGSGTDHCLCWVKAAFVGAGWKFVNCDMQS